MLYILLGEDDFSIRQSLEGIKKDLGDQALLSLNTTALDGGQLTLEDLRAVCETAPFLAARRLVMVRGLLGRFERKGQSGRQKKVVAAADQQGGHGRLASYIGQMSEGVVLVLIDSRISKGNPLLQEISGKAEIRTFPRMRDSGVQRWIQRRVAEEGKGISSRAVGLLTKLIGGNLWVMDNEIDKLVLFASGRQIEEEDVRLLVSHSHETSVFAMIDAILESKASVAEQLLQQLLQRGAAPAYLMVMLSRQVQMVVRARELRGQAKSEAEIRSQLGLSSEFVLRKTLEQAARYPSQRLREMYHKLLETDLSVKTGRRDAELALTILIAELCQRRRASR